MAYGGRAYDDDKPWWKDDDDDDNNNTSSKPTETPTRDTDDFDSPPPDQSYKPKKPKKKSTQQTQQTNFHGASYGKSYGVYNAYGNSAYDDHNSYYEASKPSKPAPKQNNTSSNTDPYDAITSKSKYNKKANSNNNAYDNKPPAFTKAKSAYSSNKKYNGYNSKKAAQTQSSRNVHSNKASNPSYSRRNYGTADTQQGISNPAYRNIIRNKYRNGALNDEYTHKNKRSRQRPDMNTMQQQQEYKQQLRDQTISHLDQSLRTAYQSEELAADTSEVLYNQRKQLENVDKMLHETDQNLDRTEFTLKGMKSVWGGIGNYFKKAPERQVYEKRKSVDTMNLNKKMTEWEKEKAQRGYSKKRKQVKLGGRQEEDEEFNDKLDELHKSVQRMKLMAQNMNNELDDQGGLLENIDDKMGKVDARIDKQNYTMKRIR